MNMNAPSVAGGIRSWGMLMLMLGAAMLGGRGDLAAQEDAPRLSATYMMTKNLAAKKMQPYSQPDTVIFHMTGGAPGRDVVERAIEIRRGDATWTVPVAPGVSEVTTLPRAWGWDAKGAASDESPYLARLVVRTSEGKEHRSNELKIPARINDSRYARFHRPAGSRVYKYSLCLFEFDKAHLGSLNTKILEEYVVPDITKESRIEVIGHMDIIGLEEHNWRLSENRARSVVREIRKNLDGDEYRTLEGRGVGEGDPIYTNDLPEGRFYNRTTQVIVVNPGGMMEDEL